MKTKFYQIALLCIAFLGMANVVNAQTLVADYDPFTTGKTNLTPADVVAGSYLRYQVPGDQGFGASNSTFVWYVEGGVMGTFIADVWTPIVDGSLTAVDAGKTTELTGSEINSTKNSSEIWVKWDDVFTTGYIAVYELSPNGCITDNIITGFKVSNLDVINAWFTQATDDACSTDDVAIQINLSVDPSTTNINADKYYPITIAYTDNADDQPALIINKGDVTVAGGNFYYTLTATHTYTVSADEMHTFVLSSVKDKNGAIGGILNDATHFNTIAIGVHRLPTIGVMVQN